MKYFQRALLHALRYKFTLAGIFITSMLVAVLWGANIAAVYPFIEVGIQNKSMHDWVDESIDKARKTCDGIESKLADLHQQLPSATKIEQGTINGQIASQQNRLKAEQKSLERLAWLEPWIKNYLPNDAFKTLVAIVLFVLVGTVFKCIFLVINLMLVQHLAQMTTFDLRNQFFQQMLKMELSVFGRDRTGDLMSRVTGDIAAIGSTVAFLFGKAVREPLKMIVCLILAATISWRLLVISFLICPIMVFVMYRLSGSVKRASRRLLEDTAKLFGRLSQALSGIQVVKAFTMESQECRRFRRIAKDVYSKTMRITIYGSLSRINNEVLGVGVICLAILAGGYLVVYQETHLFGIKVTDRALNFTSLMLFYAYLIGVSDPARKLADMMITVQGGVAACDRVYPMMDREPSIVDPPHPKSIDNFRHDLIFDRVSFHYLPQQPVINEFSLTIPFGERLAIVGPNGCGKSTLVNLIPRFYDPVQGEIRIGDVDLRDVRQRDLRRQIGMVTQQTQLFDDTVANNIRYGSPGASDEAVIEAAQKARAHRFIIEKLENGYDTNVGETGGRLSGGQRQRIALARAILRDPAILILDEATSQIDPESELLLHQALQKFSVGRTTIMITHRMSTIALADRVLVMDSGRIVDLGTHDELIGRCDLYQRLYQSALRESA